MSELAATPTGGTSLGDVAVAVVAGERRRAVRIGDQRRLVVGVIGRRVVTAPGARATKTAASWPETEVVADSAIRWNPPGAGPAPSARSRRRARESEAWTRSSSTTAGVQVQPSPAGPAPADEDQLVARRGRRRRARCHAGPAGGRGVVVDVDRTRRCSRRGRRRAGDLRRRTSSRKASRRCRPTGDGVGVDVGRRQPVRLRSLRV